jgi:hypothetical protein
MTEAEAKELRKLFPGGQIPAKELFQPDPVAKSEQGPLEVVRATFANSKIKHGKRHG